MSWVWSGDEPGELKGVGGIEGLPKDREKIAKLHIRDLLSGSCVYN